MDDKNLKGTTTVGLTCSDGLVLVADKRASAGRLIASKRAKKIFQLNDFVGATVAGSVGDAEALMRLVQAEASLYEMNNEKPMSAKAIATLLSNILHGSKYFPYLVQLLIGGMDPDNPQFFTLDPIGGLIEEAYAATGSGSPIAYGVLEQLYSEDMSVEECVPVALKAINSAISRDAATGDGLTLVTINKEEGFNKYTEEEIQELLESME